MSGPCSCGRNEGGPVDMGVLALLFDVAELCYDLPFRGA